MLGEFLSTFKVDNEQYVSKGEKGKMYFSSVSHLIERIPLCHILQQESGPSHFANLKIIDIIFLSLMIFLNQSMPDIVLKWTGT